MYKIEDLESKGISIKSVRGDEVLACCPFHLDRNPSFAANLKKGVYICFACGEKGSFRKLDIEAPEKVTWDSFKNLLGSTESDLVFGIPKESQRIKQGVYLNYLTNRGLSENVIRKFDLGFCDSGEYEKRIIVPLESGFVARSIFGSKMGWLVHGRNFRKYLYPLGLPVSKMLFNFDPKAKKTILVEGVFDVLKLASNHINSVAIFGSQLRDFQVKKLCKSNIVEVTLCFDSDQAGEIAVKSGVELLSNYFHVRIMKLPKGEDPASVSIDIFRECYDQAIDAKEIAFDNFSSLL